MKDRSMLKTASAPVWVRRGYVVWLLILLFASPAWASGKRVALVIGNAGYQGIQALNAPVRDAQAIGKALQQAHGFQVTVLQNAGREDMLRAINRFVRDAARADSAVIYFSGHGVSNESRQNFLLPIGMRDLRELEDFESELRISAVSVDQIADDLMRTSAKVQLLVIDACRDYPVGKTMGKPLVPVNPVSSSLLLAYATEPGKVARDGVGSALSPYAAALSQELSTSGSEDGLLALFDRVSASVMQQTGNAQRPWRSGTMAVNTCIAGDCAARIPVRQSLSAGAEALPQAALSPRPPAPTPEATATLASRKDEEAWSQAKRSHTIASYRGYLEQFPSGGFIGQAEAATRALERDDARRQEEDVWNTIRNGTDLTAFMRFVTRFPTSLFRHAAMEKLAGRYSVTRQGCAVGSSGAGMDWSGACANGLAQGPGTLAMAGLDVKGSMRDGLFIGRTEAHFREKDGTAPPFTRVVTHETVEGQALNTVEIDFPNGARYLGETNITRTNRPGRPHGRGKMVFANGDIYEGLWDNGKSEGQGAETKADGTRASGIYRQGALYQGTVALANGQRLVGTFSGGRLQDGWTHYPDGTRRQQVGGQPR